MTRGTTPKASKGTVYNTTDGPLPLDDAGRVLGAREHRPNVPLGVEPVAGHITAGRLIVTPTTPTPTEEG